MKSILTAIGLSVLTVVSGGELLPNSDFSKQKNGRPSGWMFSRDAKLTLDGTVLTLTGRGYLAAVNKTRRFPVNSQFKLSGQYRLRRGENLFVTLDANADRRDGAPPFSAKKWKLSGGSEWKNFEFFVRFEVPLQQIRLRVDVRDLESLADFRGLSLTCVPALSVPRKEGRYVWREAENLFKGQLVRANAAGIVDAVSGRGGVYADRTPFIWNMIIPEETDPVTLFPRQQRWQVWLRLYGFLDAPRLTVQWRDRRIAEFATRVTEKADSAGRYSGAGTYYWQYAGEFVTDGGSGTLRITPLGRMLIDAAVLTTDKSYHPAGFEARPGKNDPIIERKLAHEIRGERSRFGISDQIVTPLVFRIGGATRKIPDHQASALFHIALPEEIEVIGVSSHFSTPTVNSPAQWGKRFISFSTGKVRRVNAVKLRDYTVKLHYLSRNQYFVFVRAKSGKFKDGQKLRGEYFLEYGTEKQSPESLRLEFVALRRTPAFKKIRVGGAGDPFLGIYAGYPEFFSVSAFLGYNVLEAWGLKLPEQRKLWETFRAECRKNNMTVFSQLSPFFGVCAASQAEGATGVDGKVLRRDKGGSYYPSLALDRDSAIIKKNM